MKLIIPFYQINLQNLKEYFPNVSMDWLSLLTYILLTIKKDMEIYSTKLLINP